MASLNFPDPSASPWTDPNDVVWEHDGDGWINKLGIIAGGGNGNLPNGGLTNQVISKSSNADQDYDWHYIYTDAGIF